MIERLEDRRLLNADWITLLPTSFLPEATPEGQYNAVELHFDTQTPYLIYNVHVDDGLGGTSDSWTLDGGGGAYYEDSGATLSADLMEDQGWDMQSVWHQDWYVYNLQPTATLTADTSGEGITLGLINPTDPSEADTASGFLYSYGATYADLGLDWTSDPTPRWLDSESNPDGVCFARIMDKDGGYSDYCSDYLLPTINWSRVDSDSIFFSWNSNITSGQEQHWLVARADDVNGHPGTFQIIDTLDPGRSDYTDQNVEPETRYWYRVRAQGTPGTPGDTQWSGKRAKKTHVAPPSEVSASETGASTATVEWLDNSTEEDGYNIYRSNDGGATWTLAAYTGADVTSLAGVQVGSWDSEPLFKVRAFVGTYNSPDQESDDVDGVTDTSVTPATPTVVTQPPGTLSLSGADTTLDVLGSALRGESYLTYTWSATSLPTGADDPVFDDNGTNAGKYTTVTFFKAGTYHLVCTIENNGASVTSNEVTVTVSPTLSGIDMNPGFVDLSDVSASGGVQQEITATGVDQFGDPLTNQPSTFYWKTDNPSGIVSFSPGPHSTGRGIPAGVLDPYWRVDGVPAVVLPQYANWLSSGSEGSWIGKPNDTATGPTDYVFSTIVTLEPDGTGFLNLSGYLASNQKLVDILINGQSTGVSYSGEDPDLTPYYPQYPFGFSSNPSYFDPADDPDPLVEGANIIEFIVHHDSPSTTAHGLTVVWDNAADAADVTVAGVAGAATASYVVPRLTSADATISVSVDGFIAYSVLTGTPNGVHSEPIGDYKVKAIPTQAVTALGDFGPEGWISKLPPTGVPNDYPSPFTSYVDTSVSILDCGQFFMTGHTEIFSFARGALGDGPGDDLALFNGGWSEDGYRLKYYWSRYDGSGGVTDYYELPKTKIGNTYNWQTLNANSAVYRRGYHSGLAFEDPQSTTTPVACAIDLENTTVPRDAFVYRIDMYVYDGDKTADFLGMGALNFAPPEQQPPPQPTIPNQPTGLSALPQSGPQMQLSWMDNSSDELGFNIERREASSATWQKIDQVGESSVVYPTYIDRHVSPGETYFYRVNAFNSAGTSAYTDTTSASIPGTPVDPPTIPPTNPPTNPPPITPSNPARFAVRGEDKDPQNPAMGAIVNLNDDDDDHNGTIDWQQRKAVYMDGNPQNGGDSDLIKLIPSVSGRLTVAASRKAYRIWEHSNHTGVLLGMGSTAGSVAVTAGVPIFLEGLTASTVAGAIIAVLKPDAGGPTTQIAATVRDVDVLIGADSATDDSTADDWVGAKHDNAYDRILNYIRVNGPPGMSMELSLYRAMNADPTKGGYVTLENTDGTPIVDLLTKVNVAVGAPFPFIVKGDNRSQTHDDVSIEIYKGNELTATETLTVLKINAPAATYGSSPVPLNPAVVNEVEHLAYGNLFGSSRTEATPRSQGINDPRWNGFCWPDISNSPKIKPDKIEIAWGRTDYSGAYRGSVSDATLDVRPQVTDLASGYRTAFRMRDKGSFPPVPMGTVPTVTYYIGHPSGQAMASMRLDRNYAASITAEYFPHVNIPVFVHILKGPTMSAGVTMNDVNSLFDDVNVVWTQAARSFTISGFSIGGLAGTPETLSSDDLMDVRDNGQGPIGELEEVTDINEQANAIDVYFVSKIYSLTYEVFGTRKEITGSTIVPTANPFGQDPGIVIAGQGPQFHPTSSSIRHAQMVRCIAHELGHYLSKLSQSVHSPETVWRLMASGVSDTKRDIEATLVDTINSAGIGPGNTD